MSENGTTTTGKIGMGLAGCAMPVIGLLGLILHLFTVLMAFAMSGFIGALITLALPVVSELYWLAVVVRARGFDNNYVLGCALYVALWGVVGLGGWLMERGESKS